MWLRIETNFSTQILYNQGVLVNVLVDSDDVLAQLGLDVLGSIGVFQCVLCVVI